MLYVTNNKAFITLLTRSRLCNSCTIMCTVLHLSSSMSDHCNIDSTICTAADVQEGINLHNQSGLQANFKSLAFSCTAQGGTLQVAWTM